MNFAQATHFVRIKLAHASNKQLRHSGLDPYDRDKLLQKPVILTTDVLDGDDASFDLKESHLRKASYVRHGAFDTCENLLETAAHEQFHAAKFWGTHQARYYLQNYAHYLFPIGMAMTGSGAILGLPWLQASGIGTCAAGYGYVVEGNDRLRYNEEMGARRFGYLFNPSTYEGEAVKLAVSFKNAEPGDRKNQAAKRKKIGYPDLFECAELYRKTVQECVAMPCDDMLFPGGSDDIWREYAATISTLPQDIFIEAYRP